MTWTLLALALAAPPPAPEPPVEVTGRFGDKPSRWAGSLATLWEGLALTLVGSSSQVSPLKAEDWKAAVQKKHLLVSFAKPQAVRGPGGGTDGRTYAVTAILIRVSDAGVVHGLWVRCGDAYHAFEKYNGALALFLEERYLPKPK